MRMALLFGALAIGFTGLSGCDSSSSKQESTPAANPEDSSAGKDPKKGTDPVKTGVGRLPKQK